MSGRTVEGLRRTVRSLGHIIELRGDGRVRVEGKRVADVAKMFDTIWHATAWAGEMAEEYSWLELDLKGADLRLPERARARQICWLSLHETLRELREEVEDLLGLL